MYCPACGTETAGDQKYCRACGMPLQTVFQAIGEHFGDGVMVRVPPPRLERWGAIIASSGFSLLVLLLASCFICLVIATIFGWRFEDFGFDFIGPIVAPLGILLLVAGACMLGYRTIRRELAAYWSSPNSLPPSRQTGKLLSESRFEAMTSVTENTTEILDKPEAKRPKGDASRARTTG
jgi:hypothetical protein